MPDGVRRGDEPSEGLSEDDGLLGTEDVAESADVVGPLVHGSGGRARGLAAPAPSMIIDHDLREPGQSPDQGYHAGLVSRPAAQGRRASAWVPAPRRTGERR